MSLRCRLRLHRERCVSAQRLGYFVCSVLYECRDCGWQERRMESHWEDAHPMRRLA